MAAIAGVVATMDIHNKLVTDKYCQIGGTLVFGDGTLTYPTGGVPVTAAQLGFRQNIRNLIFVDAAHSNGYIYKWDQTNKKILIYEVDSTSDPLSELDSSARPAAMSLVVRAEGF